MRYYLIAGEKSGDIYGGRLMQAIKKEDPQAAFRFFGGDCMQASGGTLVKSYTELAFMGLDFVGSLKKIYRYLQYCKKDILAFQPDALILIDYAGFNLRITQFAKKHRIKTFYYISPKIWAWNSGRIHRIKAYVDKMFTILPFETEFYQKYDYQVAYVGNPVIEQIRSHVPHPNFRSINQLDHRPMIALLPGSRIQEVKRTLPTMLAIVSSLPSYQFVLAAMSELPAKLYQQASQTPGVKLVYNQTYDLLANAYAAVVSSGTATLEAACFQVPQVVVYKTHFLTYTLAKWLIKLPYISLVNILAGQEAVKELIQHQLTPKNLLQALQASLCHKPTRDLQLACYQQIIQSLGEQEASKTTAQLIVSYLKNLAAKPLA